jgi:heme-degrading monooxygenase HmoA
VAVIFTSVRTGLDPDGYAATAERMEQLAADRPGYLGIESARDADGFGITVSYWTTPEAARAWKLVAEHLVAQELGRDRWYATYRVRIARVERDYGPPDPSRDR